MSDPIEVSARRPGFIPIDDYLKFPRNASTWLVHPLIPTSGAALLYGAEKTGKSYLAIQLALAISGKEDNFLGFPIIQHGPALILQLDTPAPVWAERLDDIIHKKGVPYTPGRLFLADRETIATYPFDILQPKHMAYLHTIVHQHDAVAVIIDTLRESHSGEENDSTIARNVITNLVGATHPAALILISHSRKPSQETDKSLVTEHRGSSYVTGRMDAIMRLTPTRLAYTGRSIEEGSIKLERMDSGLWKVRENIQEDLALQKVMADTTLQTLRSKARVMSVLTAVNEETCLSRIRRTMTSLQKVETSEIVSNFGDTEVKHLESLGKLQIGEV